MQYAIKCVRKVHENNKRPIPFARGETGCANSWSFSFVHPFNFVFAPYLAKALDRLS